VAYEPAFYDVRPITSAVRQRVQQVLSEFSGFKYVFDPAGYPFRELEDATIEDMERDGVLWMALNTAVLNYSGLRVVFLRRWNEFDRTVSEFVGRATDLWGFAEPEVSPGEPEIYREAVSQVLLPPLNEDLIHWHVENMPRIQDRLRSSITSNAVMDVSYEDFFGDEVALPERIERFAEIVRFLQIPGAGGI
jgi:hypothetical protein